MHDIRSIQVIERQCGRDVGYRFIVGDAASDHTAIARFRQHYVARMRAVFLVVLLRLCHEASLVRLGLVALGAARPIPFVRAGTERTYNCGASRCRFAQAINVPFKPHRRS
jgi:hypothetical protein